MPEKIKVALVTHAGGSHMDFYLTALAATDECNEVVLADRCEMGGSGPPRPGKKAVARLS
jgi:hypothetical protein